VSGVQRVGVDAAEIVGENEYSARLVIHHLSLNLARVEGIPRAESQREPLGHPVLGAQVHDVGSNRHNVGRVAPERVGKIDLNVSPAPVEFKRPYMWGDEDGLFD